jgi:hypothetical protein
VRAAQRYNDLVASNAPLAAEEFARLLEAFQRKGILFDGRPMSTFLRPHFVDRGSWDHLRQAGRRLLELAARTCRTAFGGDVSRLLHFLGTPEAEARWVSLDPGEPDVVLSRLDAFLTPEGPRFIEINNDAPAGFGYGDRMAEAFQELPLFQAFAREVPLGYLPSGPRLVEAVLAAWHRRGGEGSPVVAIGDWRDVKTRADQEILQETFEAAGLACCLADPRDFSVASGRLWAGSRRVDVVYRRGVLSELLEQEEAVRDFLTAYREGLAVFVNSFRCRLSEDKALFALLSDEAFEGLLSGEEREFVKRFVPWTRKLEERQTRREGREIDLVPYILGHREVLVLKPAHGYGGRAVWVGDETEAVAWEGAVMSGLGGPWVVQERVPIPEELFPVLDGSRLTFESFKVNANPFYIAGAEVGAVTRASRSSVINVSAGGGSVPTFVVG